MIFRRLLPRAIASLSPTTYAPALKRELSTPQMLTKMAPFSSMSSQREFKKPTPTSELYKAVENSNFLVAQIYLRRNADVNAGDPSPLEMAVSNGDVQLVKLLLSYGAKDPENKAFYVATKLRKEPKISWLLEQAHTGVTPSNPLEFAIKINDLAEIEKRLEEFKYNRSLLNNALLYAIRTATPNDFNVKAIISLILKGADVNHIEASKGTTPLMEAAELGQESIVQALLKFKPDLFVKAYRGFNALDAAIRSGNNDVAQKINSAMEAAAKTKAPEGATARAAKARK